MKHEFKSVPALRSIGNVADLRAEVARLREELGQAGKSLADWIRDHELLNRKLNETIQERDALRAVLLDAEWVEWVPTSSEAQCPSCGAFASYDIETNAYDGKHHNDCALRAALGEANP